MPRHRHDIVAAGAGGRQQDDRSRFEQSIDFRQRQLSQNVASSVDRRASATSAAGGRRAFAMKHSSPSRRRRPMSDQGKTEGEAIQRPSRRMDCFRIVSRERA
jgi:hypothetical protein